MALYTPFMEKVGSTLGASMARTGRAELAGSAYMGDPNAMAELMRVDPDLGIQIQERKRMTQQKQVQAQAQGDVAAQKKQAAQRKIYMENKDIMDDIFQQAAKFENFDEAKAFIQSEFNKNSELLADHADASGFTPESFDQLKKVYAGTGKDGEADQVQSSKILAGGLVELVMKSGEVRTITQEQENVEKIKEAERYGAELQGLRAGERGAAKAAQKKAGEAFTKMVSVRNAISMYDEGIRLLEIEGADTGPVESMFPSFKTASVELDNIQANLGLNVIQNTTFGSLSTEELKFALSTTMPQKLNAPELAAWMKKKRAAQDKLAKYLEETATFLGTPGNTIADFLRQKKTKQFSSTEEIKPKTKMSDNDYAARKRALGL